VLRGLAPDFAGRGGGAAAGASRDDATRGAGLGGATLGAVGGGGMACVASNDLRQREVVADEMSVVTRDQWCFHVWGRETPPLRTLIRSAKLVL
jgi:hypothetical protein